MSLEYKCDICGKRFPLDDVNDPVPQIMFGSYCYSDHSKRIDHFYDVCPDCYKLLLERASTGKDTV